MYFQLAAVDGVAAAILYVVVILYVVSKVFFFLSKNFVKHVKRQQFNNILSSDYCKPLLKKIIQ